MNASPSFPNDCPSACPPTDAKDADVTVYRSVRADPPTPDDFLSYLELGKRVSRKDQCDACGLSVMEMVEDAIHHRDALPGLYRFVARAQLMPEHGKTKPTASGKYPSHTSWWPYQGVDRCELFEVVQGL